jgi:hypothetical protein
MYSRSMKGLGGHETLYGTNQIGICALIDGNNVNVFVLESITEDNTADTTCGCSALVVTKGRWYSPNL